MKVADIIYQRFKLSVNRITDLNLQEFAEKYVYGELVPSDFLSLSQTIGAIPEFNSRILKHESVLIQTVVILTLMEASDNKQEFENVNKKRKKRLTNPIEKKKEIEGFDKILKGIMQVPKPKENK